MASEALLLGSSLLGVGRGPTVGQFPLDEFALGC